MTEKILPRINLTLCNHCNLCVAHCPEHALEMKDQGPVFIDPATCTYCMECESLCPTGAIRTPMVVAWSINT